MPNLSELVRGGTPLLVPGVSNPFEALLAQDAGFEVLYVTGYGSAASLLGVPDVGIAGLEDVLRNLSAIRSVVTTPLIVDADTGYGDLKNIKYTVERLEAAGANAIQLEDQVWPKKCGHMDSKSVIPSGEARMKIEAAVCARKNDDTLVIARTDAIGPNGFEDAIERANSYREVGADATFIDAPQSLEQLESIPSLVSGTCVANMSESGLTPLKSFDELVGMGYSIVLFPTMALRVAGHAVKEAFRGLKRDGTSEFSTQMMSLEECNTLLQLDAFLAFESSLSNRRSSSA